MVRAPATHPRGRPAPTPAPPGPAPPPRSSARSRRSRPRPSQHAPARPATPLCRRRPRRPTHLARRAEPFVPGLLEQRHGAFRGGSRVVPATQQDSGPGTATRRTTPRCGSIRSAAARVRAPPVSAERRRDRRRRSPASSSPCRRGRRSSPRHRSSARAPTHRPPARRAPCPSEPRPSPTDRVGLEPYRIVVRDQRHGAAAPLDDLPLRGAVPPSAASSAAPAARRDAGRLPASARSHPVVRRRFGFGGPALQDRQVAQRRVTQRPRLEPGDVARERRGLQEVAGTDDGVDAAQQPLLVLRPARRSSDWPPPTPMRRSPRPPIASHAARRRRAPRRAHRQVESWRRLGGAVRHLGRPPAGKRCGAAEPGPSGSRARRRPPAPGDAGT